jgi:hypothetical protein
MAAKRKKTPSTQPEKRQKTHDKVSAPAKFGQHASERLTYAQKTLIPDEGLACPLLSLPAELRNAIYEYALVEKNDVEINSDLKIPGLLQTSRQIRHESAKIWMLQNNFVACIYDCDATFLKRFYSVGGMLGDTRRDFSLGLVLHGERSWTNLMDWCEALHKGGSWCLQMDEGAAYHTDWTEIEAVVAAAHELCITCRKLPWKQCEKALSGLRYAVGKSEAGWLE